MLKAWNCISHSHSRYESRLTDSQINCDNKVKKNQTKTKTKIKHKTPQKSSDDKTREQCTSSSCFWREAKIRKDCVSSNAHRWKSCPPHNALFFFCFFFIFKILFFLMIYNVNHDLKANKNKQHLFYVRWIFSLSFLIHEILFLQKIYDGDFVEEGFFNEFFLF